MIYPDAVHFIEKYKEDMPMCWMQVRHYFKRPSAVKFFQPRDDNMNDPTASRAGTDIKVDIIWLYLKLVKFNYIKIYEVLSLFCQT